MIFGDDTLVLVAEHEETKKVLGTASVVLDIGAYTDLLGEFGRLAVHPDARGHGVGTLLMRGRLERVRDRLHVGITEARVVHPFSQKIAEKHGFAAVGFLPMKVKMEGRREHVCLMVQHFDPALELRRNNPRIVPEVYRLAGTAMEHVGLASDVVVDEEAAPYPASGQYEIREMSADGYSDLLRIERGRVRKREVYGPLQLHYGLFKLQANRSNYLIACDEEGNVAGAIGFTVDSWEKDVRVFELISLEDDAVRFLLRELVRRCREELGVVLIEIDVGANAPRIQRTLLELGFVPAAYVPAMAFQRVERRDVVKFVKLHAKLDVGEVSLVASARPIADLVLESFQERAIEPRISEVLDRMDLFQGLNEEQVQRVAAISGYQRFEAGEAVFRSEEPGEEMFLVLTGEVSVRMPGGDEVGVVGPGECLGEIALLTRKDHYCAGIASEPVEAGILTREDMRELVRLRPDIGVVLYRNLALGLGDKLHRTDRTLVGRSEAS